jgi:hypothetical protein
MRSVFARYVALAALGAALLLGFACAPAAAQGGAGECALPPLTLPLFGGTPVTALISPEASPGVAMREVSEEEITAAVEQIIACVNAGDPLLVYAVFSPGWFAREFADPQTHYLPAFERMLDTEDSLPGEPLVLAGIDTIAALPDGRVEVVATFRSGASTWHDTLVLVEIDGNWLIDGLASADATP